MTGMQNKFIHFFNPKYSETYLFLVSIVLLLFLITKDTIQEKVIEAIQSGIDGILLMLIVAVAILYPIFHVFSKKKKSPFAKTLMLALAITINAVAGLGAGFHILFQQSSLIFMVFPILNILSAWSLVFLWSEEKINEHSISDTNAKYNQVVVGVIGVLLIFVVTQIYIEMYWAITLSMCLSYASFLDTFSKKIIIVRN